MPPGHQLVPSPPLPPNPNPAPQQAAPHPHHATHTAHTAVTPRGTGGTQTILSRRTHPSTTTLRCTSAASPPAAAAAAASAASAAPCASSPRLPLELMDTERLERLLPLTAWVAAALPSTVAAAAPKGGEELGGRGGWG